MLAAGATRAQAPNEVRGNLRVVPGTINNVSEPGNLSVAGDTRLNSVLYLNASSAQVPNFNWVLTGAQDQHLYLKPNWEGSKQTLFYNNGDVYFSRRVSIGDVGCPPAGSSCGGGLDNVMNSLTLAVGGKLGARSVHVVAPQLAWPDYVFGPAHRLRPLPEVEQFVQANGHLPDMPSAATVQAQGLDLGEMDALLLRKVEELTLYLLALRKENQALQARISKLEN